MPDPRFTRLRSDPRFRTLKRHKNKVAVDSRFSSVFSRAKKKSQIARVDKYGRQLSDSLQNENLRRFYRFDSENQNQLTTGPDYARGEVLLQSSDEDEEGKGALEAQSCDDEDDGGVIILGPNIDGSVPGLQGGDEVDLDENDFVDADAQATHLPKITSEDDQESSPSTRRIAVVDLDWDHIRAIHLYKIFTSTIVPAGSSSSRPNRVSAPIVRGEVLSVRIYPSKFGLERMAHEENGPPPELLKKKKSLDGEEDVNERTIYETGNADEYDEDALRKYQLQRMRYFYAVVECDSPELASYLYSELQGAELERSANVLSLSFVPDDMTFDEECRDQATSADNNTNFQPLDFATDALRHSRVKLIWDQDDPERDRVTRRALTLKEIEQNDFHAYVASSSGSSSENETKSIQKTAKRDKLRALLLSGGGTDLPEGWGGSKTGDKDTDDGDVDMEVTFRPALSGGHDEDETTIGKYRRKMRERRKKRKQDLKDKVKEKQPADDFFAHSEGEEDSDELSHVGRRATRGEQRNKVRKPSTKEELSLLVAPDGLDSGPKHFDMGAIIKAEKNGRKSHKGKGKKAGGDDENELQDNFAINVKDERFRALHEDHVFAIDPSNPHFKRTKSMSALLEERSKRKSVHGEALTTALSAKSETPQSLASLVERVKRRNAVTSNDGVIKRRKP